MPSVNLERNGVEHMAFNATNKALLADKFSAERGVIFFNKYGGNFNKV